MSCLLGCSLGKCTLELLQTEEDLTLRFPRAGAFNPCMALTKKTPHGCAIPITSSTISRACFQRAWPLLSSAGSQMPSVGVRCALGTGNGMGPEGLGLRAASFLCPALPSSWTQSHVSSAASGQAVKQSWRCPGCVRASLWAQAAPTFGSRCTESSWISALETGGHSVTLPVHTPTASLWCSHPVLCLNHVLGTVPPSQMLCNPFLLAPTKPFWLLFLLSCHGALCLDSPYIFFSEDCLSMQLLSRLTCLGTAGHSGCVTRGSPGTPIAKVAHKSHRLLQKGPPGTDRSL